MLIAPLEILGALTGQKRPFIDFLRSDGIAISNTHRYSASWYYLT
jgi:hypothetical protein